MTVNPSFYQVTEYLQPDDWVDTAYGKRRAIYWLALEVARWADKGDLAIIKSEAGMVALFGFGNELNTEEQHATRIG